jgi:hypothetical protein
MNSRRTPLWRTVPRQAERNGWTRVASTADGAGLVIHYERRDEWLEVRFGPRRSLRIPFVLARYRPALDATLVTISAPAAVLKLLEAQHS